MMQRGVTSNTMLVFLGDLVDRGPNSAGTVERVRQLAIRRPRIRLLMGNHEEIFLRSIAGDEKALKLFTRIGGRETMLSYGVDPSAYDRMDYDDLALALKTVVPQSHVDFLTGFEDMIFAGDYAFVHAGVRPDVPLGEQHVRDLRWIRDPFIDFGRSLEKVVVHGHTIASQPEFRRHRIGIDTGAYDTGRLTALGLGGTDRWTIEVDSATGA